MTENVAASSLVEIPAAAPDVFFVGIDIYRSILHPIREADRLTWSISGERYVDTDDEVMFRVWGDLGVVEAGWFSGSTVVGLIGFRGEAVPEDDRSNDDLLAVYGPWAAHVLWDLAATAVRLAAAQSVGVNFGLSSLTPTPHLLLERDRAGATPPEEPVRAD